MKSHQHDTAVLLFARTAESEAGFKRLAKRGGATANHRVHKLLARYASNTAEFSGLPVFHISEHQQRGESFGQRLENAFQDVFDAGFSKVVAIGSDCAQLTPELLRNAAQALQQANSVMGPSRDGGVYLIGLTHALFAQHGLRGVTWQTDQVFDELQALFGTSAILDTLSDIDKRSDLVRVLLSGSIDVELAQQLAALLMFSERHIVVPEERAMPKRVFQRDVSRRGPPVKA